jgi:hypothetical protein
MTTSQPSYFGMARFLQPLTNILDAQRLAMKAKEPK